MTETPRDKLAPNVAPLNDEERAWIRSMERVLKRMPRRLWVLECADTISVIDRAASGPDVDLSDGGAGMLGVVLAELDSSTILALTSVSG